MILGIVVAGVVVIATTFFDAADTASIIESIEISSPTLYSEQGFVSVQVKNNGNTGIQDVHAVLLVTDATGATTADCAPGIDPMLITTNVAALAVVAVGADNVPGVTSLNPSDSITISGGLRDVGAITVSSAGDTNAATVVATSLACDGGDIKDRGEYILQINGNSDGDVISKTVTLRAR